MPKSGICALTVLRASTSQPHFSIPVCFSSLSYAAWSFLQPPRHPLCIPARILTRLCECWVVWVLCGFCFVICLGSFVLFCCGFVCLFGVFKQFSVIFSCGRNTLFHNQVARQEQEEAPGAQDGHRTTESFTREDAHLAWTTHEIRPSSQSWQQLPSKYMSLGA